VQQQRKLHVQEKDGRQQKQQLVQLLQDVVDEDEQLQKAAAVLENVQHQSENVQHQSENVQHQSEDAQALKEDVDKLPIPSFFQFFLDYLLLQ
jgi:gamma-glutamyltranspeptidase